MHPSGIDTVEERGLPDGGPPREGESLADLHSPFANQQLWLEAPGDDAVREYLPEVASPFTEALSSHGEASLESELMEMLLGELEDEDFVEGLEAVGVEAAGRAMTAGLVFDGESGVPVIDASEAERWVEEVGDRADRLLAELEDRFRDRPVDAVSDEELDAATEACGVEGFADPLDAQELFFGRLKKKLRKIAGAAKKFVKKGIKLASTFSPLGLIFKRLRPIIKPLLRKVLAKAIGKLPRSLRAPARQLARRFGLQAELGTGEPESEADLFAAEFDMQVAEAMLAPDEAAAEALEMELLAEERADEAEANVAEQLDRARDRLTRDLLAAEPGTTPTQAMEQFVPMAILPIVRTGIKLVGRRRVVNFVAGLLAKLIRPVVGSQLAKPLSVQIADKGLGLLRLEHEAESGRLGAEAVVAAAEDVLGEVFSMPEELLENELLVESVVQEAFHRAAARHFPAEMLRGDVPAGGSGVWVMMPRSTSPVYRYRKYSQRIPVVLTRAMAREVVLSDGETLEERLTDDGETRWPVDVEMEAYELLPGADIGHLVPFETDGQDGSRLEAAAEFDTVEEAGELPLPADMERSARFRGRGRGRGRQLVRIRVRGRALRKRAPASVRLDLTGTQPSIRLHLFLGERRAMAIAQSVEKQQLRDVVDAVRAVTGRPVRRVIARRLGVMLKRRQIVRDTAAVAALTDQLFDGLLATLASQLPTLGSSLTASARDQAAGMTVTAAFPFDSTDAIGKGAPGRVTLTVGPGRRRD
ncbi:hypothetical protein GCM10009641_80810 [Mycobacterium cookii]